MSALQGIERSSLADGRHTTARGQAPNERESLAAEVARLTVAYEQTLTAALSELDERRAARAFDASDRLQNQLLLATRRLRRRATAGP
jgi:hypothetical protein